MNINIQDLKKKIIYRSAYRGSKEMDSLLGSFSKKYVNIGIIGKYVHLNDAYKSLDEALVHGGLSNNLNIYQAYQWYKKDPIPFIKTVQ